MTEEEDYQRFLRERDRPYRRIEMMIEEIEKVAVALEPMCRAFGKGDMPMNVAREFAQAAIAALDKHRAEERANPEPRNGLAEDLWMMR